MDWLNFFLIFLPVEGIVFWGLFTLVGSFFKKNPENKVVLFLKSPRGMLSLLAAFPLIGFVMHWEYNIQSGCLVAYHPVFQFENILWSGIPLLVYATLLRFPKPRLILWLTLPETLLWIFKVLFISQGYSVGFGGVADPFMMAYIAVVLSLRLWLLRYALGLRWKWYVLAGFVFVFIQFWGNFWAWIYGDLFLW